MDDVRMYVISPRVVSSRLISSYADDAPFHLSEECSNAQIATPRAIVLTSFLGGSLGWFLCLVIVSPSRKCLFS